MVELAHQIERPRPCRISVKVNTVLLPTPPGGQHVARQRIGQRHAARRQILRFQSGRIRRQRKGQRLVRTRLELRHTRNRACHRRFVVVAIRVGVDKVAGPPPAMPPRSPSSSTVPDEIRPRIGVSSLTVTTRPLALAVTVSPSRSVA